MTDKLTDEQVREWAAAERYNTGPSAAVTTRAHATLFNDKIALAREVLGLRERVAEQNGLLSRRWNEIERLERLRQTFETQKTEAIAIARDAVPMIRAMADSFTDDEWQKYEELRARLDALTGEEG